MTIMTIARRIALAVLGLGLLGTAAQAEVFVALVVRYNLLDGAFTMESS